MDLFVYGTLMVPQLMREVSGYAGPGVPAVLPDHRRRMMRGEVYPAVIPQAGETVEGLVYRHVTAPQLALLDVFEGDLYERRGVLVLCRAAPVRAETYVLAHRHGGLLSDREWSLDGFLQHGIRRFTAEYRGFAHAAADREDHE